MWCAVVALFVLAFAAPARADVPPPGCEYRGPGDPCTGGLAGTCVASKCGKPREYGGDGKTYDCVICRPNKAAQDEAGAPTSQTRRGCSSVPGGGYGGTAATIALSTLLVLTLRRRRLGRS